MSKWIHIVKTNNKLYASGKLVSAITELDGFVIVNLKIHDSESIWLKLEKI